MNCRAKFKATELHRRWYERRSPFLDITKSLSWKFFDVEKKK